jgi:hypothetical protein
VTLLSQMSDIIFNTNLLRNVFATCFGLNSWPSSGYYTMFLLRVSVSILGHLHVITQCFCYVFRSQFLAIFRLLHNVFATCFGLNSWPSSGYYAMFLLRVSVSILGHLQVITQCFCYVFRSRFLAIFRLLHNVFATCFGLNSWPSSGYYTMFLLRVPVSILGHFQGARKILDMHNLKCQLIWGQLLFIEI